MAMVMDRLKLVVWTRKIREQLHVCPAVVVKLMDSDFCWDWNIKCEKETPQEGLALLSPSLLPQNCLQVISLLSVMLVGLH